MAPLPAGEVYQANQVLFSMGKTNALQAFPLNSLINTMTSQINDATVSINTRDVLAGLLKMYNYRELAQYNSLCPSLPDSFYQNYVDGIGSNNNVLGNYSTGSFDKKFQPRGVYPCQILIMQNGVMVPYVDGNGNPLLQISATGAGALPFNSFYLKFTTTEPLLFLSPYISAHSNNKASFLGLNNLTLTLNMGDASRVMSNASYADLYSVATPVVQGANVKTISNATFVQYESAKLLLQLLSIPPSMFSKISPKNIVNYNQYTSYNFTSGFAIAANTGSNSSSIPIAFNNIQLNQVPTKMLIFARNSTLDTYDSNSFLVIKGISINFGNKSGLLSSANPTQLYDMSVRNGLQENYYEYSGQGVSSNADGDPTIVPTIGSILAIDPSLDLSIDSQWAGMVGGQFNIQFEIQLSNQTANSITPTIYLVVVNSGMFTTESGSCAPQTGLLNQEMVLNTKQQDPITDSHTYDKAIVGGSIENIGSVHKFLKKQLGNHHEKETVIDNDGAGMSASGMSAAGVASGAKRRIHKYASKYINF